MTCDVLNNPSSRPSSHSTTPHGGNGLWECTGCRKNFDTFKSRGRCSRCELVHKTTTCLACLQDSPHAEFYEKS